MHRIPSSRAVSPPCVKHREICFFNLMIVLAAIVFTPHAEASAIALSAPAFASESSPPAAGAGGGQQPAPRADEDAAAAAALGDGPKTVEDLMESMRSEWEAESDVWGWAPPQQQQPRGLSKRSGDAPVAQRMSPQERMVKMLQFDFAPLVEDLLLSKAHRLSAAAAALAPDAAPDAASSSSSSAAAAATSSVDDGNAAAAAANANLDLEQVVQKVMKATEKRGAMAAKGEAAAAHGHVKPAGASPKTKNVSAQATDESYVKLAATTPAPTSFGEVIRKVARVTADVRKMQKKNKRVNRHGGKRHAPPSPTTPSATTPSATSEEDKELVATCAPGRRSAESTGDVLQKISQRRDAGLMDKGNNESVTSTKVNSTAVDSDMAIGKPMNLIIFEADVEDKRPERMAKGGLEKDDAVNGIDSDPDKLVFVYESPDVSRNKRKLDGNLLEESWRDMGGEMMDRSSALQENRMNLIERNAVFPSIEETLKDFVERAIEENLFSGQGSFLSDVGVNEKRMADQAAIEGALGKGGPAAAIAATIGNGDGGARVRSVKDPRPPLEIKGAYWRVTDKDNGATRVTKAFKAKRQATDATIDPSQNDTESMNRDVDPLTRSIEVENTSVSEAEAPLPDGFEVKERAEKSLESADGQMASDDETAKAKRDEIEVDGKEKVDGIDKTSVAETSVTAEGEGDAPKSIDSSESLLISTTDKDAVEGNHSQVTEENKEESVTAVASTGAEEEYADDAAGGSTGVVVPLGGGGGGAGGAGGDDGGSSEGGDGEGTHSTESQPPHDSSEFYKGFERASAKQLSCFQCRSDQDNECGTSLPNQKYLKACTFDKAPERPVCRMVKREIDTAHGKKDLVMRMCGRDSASPEGGCYESLWGQQMTCECMANACNGAVSTLTRAASLAQGSHKTFMLGEEREGQNSGTNMVPWSLIYAVVPLVTFLSSRPGLFQH